MKAPRPKIHRVFRNQPLQAYTDINALCGENLRHATPIGNYLVGGGLEDMSISPMRDCRSCREMAKVLEAALVDKRKPNVGPRWLYFFMEAQAALDATREQDGETA